MLELAFGIKVGLFLFGIGGTIALAVVPWACIGTGLYDKSQQYQSW